MNEDKNKDWAPAEKVKFVIDGNVYQYSGNDPKTLQPVWEKLKKPLTKNQKKALRRKLRGKK
jgi:hypothetical protein